MDSLKSRSRPPFQEVAVSTVCVYSVYSGYSVLQCHVPVRLCVFQFSLLRYCGKCGFGYFACLQSGNMSVMGLHSYRRASSAGDPGNARLMSYPNVNIKRIDGSLWSSFQQDSWWQHPGETGEIQV